MHKKNQLECINLFQSSKPHWNIHKKSFVQFFILLYFFPQKGQREDKGRERESNYPWRNFIAVHIWLNLSLFFFIDTAHKTVSLLVNRKISRKFVLLYWNGHAYDIMLRIRTELFRKKKQILSSSTFLQEAEAYLTNL